MMVRDLEHTEKQSKHWIFNDHWTKWNGMKCRSNDGITAWFNRQDQREWKKHLWMKSNQSINHYSKLISIELSGMTKVDRHFEDLEYLNTINIQYSELLSNVTERGL